MELGVLGPLVCRLRGRACRIPPGHQRELLTRLLIECGTTVSADRLIAALWGDDLPDNPANALQGCVSQLRKHLEAGGGRRVLVKRGAGYCLDVPADAIDACCFERRCDEGFALLAADDPDAAARTFAEALALWRGPALEEVADREWALPEARRLEERRLVATEGRIAADLALGRHRQVVAEAEELVAAHPLREGLRHQLVLALYRCGRQADALAAYQAGRALLAEELGIDPNPELRRLHERILRQDPSLQPGRPEGPAVAPPGDPPAAPPPSGDGVPGPPAAGEGPRDPRAIRVFLVDDHAVVRRGMAAFLDQVDDIAVVGQADDGDQALGRLGQLAAAGALPDVVLMDVLMPRMDGITATAAIAQRHPSVRVVAVTSFSETARVHAALQAGAAGYLLKHAEADEVAIAVRAAHRGEVHLDAGVASELTRSLREPASPAAALTDREREVLRLVATGASNQAIADELCISERTARTHLSNILPKLGVASRTQAALWAVREGLVDVAELSARA